MKSSLLLITGWAHGADAVQPMADRLAGDFEVQILTGAEVLRDPVLPSVDSIITGSMGGLLVMELLPERCKKLVLISSTAKFCAEEGYACGTPEKILRRMILKLKRNPDAVLEAFFKNVHFPHECRRVVADRNHLVEGLEYLFASDVREKVPTLDLPVLLLHGAEDRIIPPTASEWLHAHLPNSKLKIFPKAGHALPAHQFEAVMGEIWRFL
jgi:pimeloyl-ACP methyl ester carboxylesterase